MSKNIFLFNILSVIVLGRADFRLVALKFAIFQVLN
jgi:hypothetical protein